MYSVVMLPTDTNETEIIVNRQQTVSFLTTNSNSKTKPQKLHRDSPDCKIEIPQRMAQIKHFNNKL